MNLNNPTTIAFEILNTVVPSLSPEKFLDALKGYFNPNLSKEENKKIMMQKIREGKLGQALADIAYYKPTSDKNFEDILDQIDYLGLQTGNEDKAKKLISKMKNRMKTLQKLRENEKATKIYHEIDPNYYSPSKFSFIGDIYQKLNYKNVADKADMSNLGYPKLSPELIISENPDLIVLPGKDNKYVEKVKLRPGWSYIKAVKKNNFLLTNNDIASRWGPRILNFASILVEYSKK